MRYSINAIFYKLEYQTRWFLLFWYFIILFPVIFYFFHENVVAVHYFVYNFKIMKFRAAYTLVSLLLNCLINLLNVSSSLCVAVYTQTVKTRFSYLRFWCLEF